MRRACIRLAGNGRIYKRGEIFFIAYSDLVTETTDAVAQARACVLPPVVLADVGRHGGDRAPFPLAFLRGAFIR